LLTEHLLQVHIFGGCDIILAKHLDPLLDALLTITLDEDSEIGHDTRCNQDVTLKCQFVRPALLEGLSPGFTFALERVNEQLSKFFLRLHVIVLVAQSLLLSLHCVQFINTCFQFCFFGSKTSLGFLFDLVSSGRCGFGNLELSLLWFDNLHSLIVLNDGLNPRSDTQRGFTSILQSCIFESVLQNQWLHFRDKIKWDIILGVSLHHCQNFL